MDLITPAQAAQRQKVSLRTVHRLINSQELPYVHKVTGATGAYLLDPKKVEEVFAGRPHRTRRTPAEIEAAASTTA